MERSRALSAFFVLAISVALATCGGGDGNGGNGGNGGGGGGGTGGAQACLGGTCTQADQAAVNQYTSCIQNACDAEFRACYGPNYASGGTASGACATYANCTNACGCNPSSACLQACGQPTGACATCTASLVTCILGATCTAPACLGAGPTGAGGAGGGTGFDGGLGGFPGLDGGFGGFGGLDAGNHTCAELLACCNGLSGQAQTACMATYNAAVGSGDQVCSLAYATFCQ